MAKNDMIDMEGIVTETLPNHQFIVKLSNGHKVTAYVSGKIRMNSIMISLGDSVTIEMSPYDLTRGRIIWRSK